MTQPCTSFTFEAAPETFGEILQVRLIMALAEVGSGGKLALVLTPNRTTQNSVRSRQQNAPRCRPLIPGHIRLLGIEQSFSLDAGGNQPAFLATLRPER